MKFYKYPTVKLLCFLILGICLAHYNCVGKISEYLFFTLCAIYSIIVWKKKYIISYKNHYLMGFYICFIFSIAGITLYQNYFDKSKQDFFGKEIIQNQKYIATISESPEESLKSVKLTVDINSTFDNHNFKNTFGKAIVYIEKDSCSLKLNYGDLIYLNSKFQEIEAPKNPEQFNYKNYLELQNIYYQSYANSKDWLLLKKNDQFSIKSFAFKLRSRLVNILYENNIHDDQLSIVAGMVLGVRDLLSPELQASYSGAGAMHILCVSGLHVGILYLILNFLLKFLDYSNKSRFLKSLIILFLIWFYALITGLSPSVVRSATMFTFIAIGQNLNRQSHIISSISSSALILLIINPTLLFNLGFQLSYSAVISIVVFQEVISSLYYPKYKIINYGWQIISVSIAAQIGTAPLSIYYFNQFPNFFILTNLIVIPAAYIIIILAILVLSVSFLPFISNFIGDILNYILQDLNHIIINIEANKYAVTRDIYLSFPMFVVSALLIVSLGLWIVGKQRKFVFASLIFLGFLIFLNQNKYNLRDEFIVYQSNKNVYRAIYSKNTAWIFCDSSVLKTPEIMKFSVYNHELKKGIKKRNYYYFKKDTMIIGNVFLMHYPFLKFGEKVVLFEPVSLKKGFPKPKFKIDYLVLSGNVDYDFAKYNKDFACIIPDNFSSWQTKLLVSTENNLQIEPYQIKKSGAWQLYFK